MAQGQNNWLRFLPAVDKVLLEEPLSRLRDKYPHHLLVRTVQEVIAEQRDALKKARGEEEALALKISPYQVAEKAAAILDNIFKQSLRPVINATGIVLHTNLGRAPLPDDAVKALQAIAPSYCNLEYALSEGVRGSRYHHLESLLCFLTGAEAALVVNNNAAAVLLALNTLAAGKEVVVSRGQLVEIGGSFRIPEVMKQSGARLVEVGTTNKTYLYDYRRAVSSETALLLKVHTSNYRIVGFTSDVSIEELVGLGRELGLPVMEDLGSGVFLDLAPYGLPHEPTAQESIKAGAGVVTVSGDKLLGGPQAGIILGKRNYIDAMKKNQLTRALRVDKLTVAALEATLKLYLQPENALEKIPVLKLLTCPVESLLARAEALAARLEEEVRQHATIQIEREEALVGGGSMPQASLPSCQLVITPHHMSTSNLAYKLRMGTPAIVARVKQGRLYLDLRSIQQSEEKVLLQRLIELLQGGEALQ